MLLLRLSGLFLLREAEAALLSLLFHEPPRKTFPGCLTRSSRARAVYHNHAAAQATHAPGSVYISVEIVSGAETK